MVFSVKSRFLDTMGTNQSSWFRSGANPSCKYSNPSSKISYVKQAISLLNSSFSVFKHQRKLNQGIILNTYTQMISMIYLIMCDDLFQTSLFDSFLLGEIDVLSSRVLFRVFSPNNPQLVTFGPMLFLD